MREDASAYCVSHCFADGLPYYRADGIPDGCADCVPHCGPYGFPYCLSH